MLFSSNLDSWMLPTILLLSSCAFVWNVISYIFLENRWNLCLFYFQETGQFALAFTLLTMFSPYWDSGMMFLEKICPQFSYYFCFCQPHTCMPKPSNKDIRHWKTIRNEILHYNQLNCDLLGTKWENQDCPHWERDHLYTTNETDMLLPNNDVRTLEE